MPNSSPGGRDAVDVRQLRYLVRIIELRSFTKAAAALGIAQPALGTHIRKLEEELGTRLMVRHSRGIEPTEAGMLLTERAAKILAMIDDTRQLLSNFSEPPRGTVKIGLTPSTSAVLAAPLVEHCAADLPAVRVNVVEGLSELLSEWVQANRIDMGLIYHLQEQRHGLAVEPLVCEDLHFIQCPATGNDNSAEIGFAEMCGNALIMPSPPHGLRRMVDDVARDRGIELDVPFEMQSVATMIDLVQRKIAGCILPLSAVARQVAEGRMIARRIVEPRITRTMSLIYPTQRPLSKAAGRLRSLITDLVPRLAASRAIGWYEIAKTKNDRGRGTTN
jgi:LysR family nitrogen assimilation transcriptional regulator